MVDQIKEMQRSDQVAKEQWYAYCEAFGDNIRDPAKHDISFINSFITQYQSGARLEYKEGQDLVKFIKLGQRKSQGWKSSWEMYCSQKPINGKPMHDPAKHDSSFLEGFFDFVGSMALGRGGMAGGWGMGGMGMGMGAQGGPPLKRGPGASSGDPAKDQLVTKIKAYQRQGEAQKQTWYSFCDVHLSGFYDPGRADMDILNMFVQSNGIQDIQPDWGGGGGGNGVGPTHPLVARIKAYQRMGETQKEAWHSYADANLGGKRDPAKADEASLQNFISTYGVP